MHKKSGHWAVLLRSSPQLWHFFNFYSRAIFYRYILTQLKQLLEHFSPLNLKVSPSCAVIFLVQKTSEPKDIGYFKTLFAGRAPGDLFIPPNPLDIKVLFLMLQAFAKMRMF